MAIFHHPGHDVKGMVVERPLALFVQMADPEEDHDFEDEGEGEGESQKAQEQGGAHGPGTVSRR